MGSTCVALGCTSRRSKKIPGITFHRFPKDEKRRQLWIKAINRENWEPSWHCLLCSIHFTEDMFDRRSQSLVRLCENAVPCIFPNFTRYHRKVLGNNAKAAGNAQVVRIVPIASENNKKSKQDNDSEKESACVNEESDESENESTCAQEESDISENESTCAQEESDKSENESMCAQEESDVSEGEECDAAKSEDSDMAEEEKITKEEENGPLTEAKNSDMEFVTYLVSEVHQQSPNLPKDLSVVLTNTSHVKDRSKVKDIISNVFQLESQVQAEESVQKKELLFKLGALEYKCEKLQQEREKDKKKIKVLGQFQRRSIKRITELKKSECLLKQEQLNANRHLEMLENASPLLLDLLKRLESQNNGLTKPRYSAKVYEFVKNLYALSPDAYGYIRNFLIWSLPHEKTVKKWKYQTNHKLASSCKENFGKDSLINDCIDTSNVVNENEERCFSDAENVNLNEQEKAVQPTVISFSSMHSSHKIYENDNNNA